MAIDVSIQLEGGEKISRRIEGISGKLRGLKPFFKKVVDLLDKKKDDTFSGAGSRLVEGSWAKLAPSTVKARKMRRGYYARQPDNPSLLRWTGNLQDNVTKRSSNKSGQLIFNAPYAAYHHFGKGQPKRKLVELDPHTSAEIIRELQVFIHNKYGIGNLRTFR